MRDPVERVLDAIRRVERERFLNGHCYSLFLILRAIWSDAECHYSEDEGHVYTKINGKFYDIRGKHVNVPEDLKPLDHKQSYRPHRW